MIKTIVFNGGLGNQMFQYAFYLALKARIPRSIYLFDVEHSQTCHQGYEIDRAFNIDSLKQVTNYGRLKRHMPSFLRRFHVVRQKESLKFEQDVFFGNGLLTRYEGFWQSEKYFGNIVSKVRDAFTFREESLNDQTKELCKCLEIDKDSFYVSLHIRRGDYLLEEEKRGLCSLTYYENAMAFIQRQVENPVFVIFSDDIKWVKKNIHAEKCKYVDWNEGSDSWQDMLLMSRCHHNIIANSSFSWWGAWLNAHPEKKVLAPKHWFLDRDNFDVLPDGWVLI